VLAPPRLRMVARATRSFVLGLERTVLRSATVEGLPLLSWRRIEARTANSGAVIFPHTRRKDARHVRAPRGLMAARDSWPGASTVCTGGVSVLAGQASRPTRSQSISPWPSLVSSLLASENGLLVRNPRHADNGDGCEDLITA
jgi:hypothetical protein